MTQLRLMDDKTLQYLWRVASRKDKPTKGRQWYAFWYKGLDQLMQLDFALLKLHGFLDVKTTLTDLAIKQGFEQAGNLERKAHASLDFRSSGNGIGDLLKQAKVIEDYFEYLKKTYKEKDPVSYNDILTIRRLAPWAADFMLMNIIIPSNKIGDITVYLDKYLQDYINRDLDGQERLYLANNYTDLILKTINSDAFIKSYGFKRVPVDGKDTSLYTHSLLYLETQGLIKIHDIKLIGNIVSATIDNLQRISQERGNGLIAPINKPKDSSLLSEFKYHAFVSYASEDKNHVAKPLADELIRLGLEVWYDEFSLKIGDSLKQKITEGLTKSKYGIVILSEHFFNKKWPQLELNALFAKMINQEGNEPIIFPIWHNLTKEQVAKYDPILADIVAGNTYKDSISELAIKLKTVINK